ncbi:MAG: iron-molybdenum cofactor biosynthesis protein [Bacteroidetes bacterium]|jgi:predicted Fe-Mo cluster-binding NifX family protein|nr:iron-molybdenum cofactor biosynthesis protein [Bacteroidota bacterium]MBT3935813.1 iron-molybdenum cofactor biosynthesis protein [Bacteroidota bacterium]MBT4968776.1 iron-molybdenum cofactor biosynthesis protein [Bacteroidota bacterium]MBT5989919.1 iron-molybdenum cofactor biosynthesis protein [Bacteroidota bacterium]MBT7040146.1 iron-molybdenum cofactor biosynthesis protein [Bacteroidota bacterium]
MKIAIPSDNGSQISRHFGRAKGFIVFTIEEGVIQNEEFVDNRFTGHSQGLHVSHGHQGGDEHHHSHQGILQALENCSIVIAGGMGKRLVTDMTSSNKQVFITKEVIARKAVELFLEDKLDHQDDLYCEH